MRLLSVDRCSEENRNRASASVSAATTVTPSMTAFAQNNYLSLAYAWRLVDVLGNVTGALDTGGFTLTTGS